MSKRHQEAENSPSMLMCMKTMQAVAENTSSQESASNGIVPASRQEAIAHFTKLMLTVRTITPLLLENFLRWLLKVSPRSGLEVIKVMHHPPQCKHLVPTRSYQHAVINFQACFEPQLRVSATCAGEKNGRHAKPGIARGSRIQSILDVPGLSDI